MLDKIKLLLGITNDEKDELITLLIDNATNEVLEYTHQDTPEGLDTIIQMVCVYNYNRLGTEGLDSEGYSGVSFNYSADYPEPIIRALKAKRKLITL